MLVACLRKAFVEKMEKVIVNVQIRKKLNFLIDIKKGGAVHIDAAQH
ncbi:hypothetical protein Tsp_14649 [Trichinella spiralis]|nr:hypothetical protein Tsp_14649 [Trichinella spiralis]